MQTWVGTPGQFLRGTMFIAQDAEQLRQKMAEETRQHEQRMLGLQAKLDKINARIAEEAALTLKEHTPDA